jgi:hypothetical protein
MTLISSVPPEGRCTGADGRADPAAEPAGKLITPAADEERPADREAA